MTKAAKWLPTPENINALPVAVRKYIHDLETNCDPAGMVRENVLLRDINAALQTILAERDEERHEMHAAFVDFAIAVDVDDRLDDTLPVLFGRAVDRFVDMQKAVQWLEQVRVELGADNLRLRRRTWDRESRIRALKADVQWKHRKAAK